LVYVTKGTKWSEFYIKGFPCRSCDEVLRKAGGAVMILANTTINLEEDSVNAYV